MKLKHRIYLSALTLMSVSFCTASTVSASTLTSKEFQPVNHYQPRSGFMNDIQTIWKGSDGYIHLYYLANDNYKHSGDGTEWRHVRTRDWEHFEDLGIAIPKFQNGYDAVASGSVVKNNSGFFKDLPKSALVAYFTSYTKTGQNQYAAYSLDDGKTYKPYSQNPVMTSITATSNNRDPFVIYNTVTKKLNMYLAEGDKIGIYESSTGKSWEYIGADILNKYTLGGTDLGLVECPNLKMMKDQITGQTKAVMFFSANGYLKGSTTGVYAQVGHLDSGVFVPEKQPERVDQGSDFYAANFYQDGDVVRSIAWSGNWDYIDSGITDGTGRKSYHLGHFTTTRTLKLANGHIQASFENRNPTTNHVTYSSSSQTAPIAADNYHKVLLDQQRWSSQSVNYTFKGIDRPVNGHIRLFFDNHDSHVFLDYNADNGFYQVSRSSKLVSASDYKKAYVVQSGHIKPSELSIYIISDKTSLEFAIGNQTYTVEKYSTDEKTTFKVETSGQNTLVTQMANLEH